MAVFLLGLSGLLFIVTFGIHSTIMHNSKNKAPMYTGDPLFSKIPWISGFIFPVLAWAKLLDYHWFLLFILNIGVVVIFGPMLTKGYLERMQSGEGWGKDMATTFIAGIISFVLGIGLL